MADAEKFGFQIRRDFLTHFHADFIAGHLELRDRCGATIHLGSRAEAEYAFVPMADGDTLEFPGVRLQVLETPGHTIESISPLVFDLKKSPATLHAVLTGDTLFTGDVGRPDLRASLGWPADDLGARLYDSLRNKLLTLPDETLVYPAHGAALFAANSFLRHGFFAWRSAAYELRTAADVEGNIRSSGYGRPAGYSTVFYFAESGRFLGRFVSSFGC